MENDEFAIAEQITQLLAFFPQEIRTRIENHLRKVCAINPDDPVYHHILFLIIIGIYYKGMAAEVTIAGREFHKNNLKLTGLIEKNCKELSAVTEGLAAAITSATNAKIPILAQRLQEQLDDQLKKWPPYRIDEVLSRIEEISQTTKLQTDKIISRLGPIPKNSAAPITPRRNSRAEWTALATAFSMGVLVVILINYLFSRGDSESARLSQLFKNRVFFEEYFLTSKDSNDTGSILIQKQNYVNATRNTDGDIVITLRKDR